MTDNSVLPGTGDTYASDDIGGVKFPRVKLIHGADDTNAGDIAITNPFPVALPSGGVIANVPSGIRLFTPSGIAVTAPSGVLLNIPSGVQVRAPAGEPLPINIYGSGTVIAANNPLPVSIPSGVEARISAPSGIDARITAPSGIGLTLPSGIALQGGSGAPISLANPLPIRAPSGYFLGLTASGLPVTASNPLPVTGLAASVATGSAVGLVASGLPVSAANPLPVNVVTGGDGSVQGVDSHDSPITADPVLVGGYASQLPPTGVALGDAVNAWHLPNGAQAIGIQASGTFALLDRGTAANALRTVIATDQTAVPISQASGARINVFAQGVEAHGSLPTGSIAQLGFEARGANPVPVASGTIARGISDTVGKQIVMPGAPLSLRVQASIGLRGTGSTQLIPAQGSGVSVAITSLSVMNGSPTYFSEVVFSDGTATLYGGAAFERGGGFAPNGGQFPLFVVAANSALNAVQMATGATCVVNVGGYKITNP